MFLQCPGRQMTIEVHRPFASLVAASEAKKILAQTASHAAAQVPAPVAQTPSPTPSLPDPAPKAATEVRGAAVQTDSVTIGTGVAPHRRRGNWLVRLASGIATAVNDMIGSAAGYDEGILVRYGTATDEKRRRNIGRAILVATAVGSLGWFTKILMTFPGAWALPVAGTIAFLYAVLSYSLESFFAANVNPFATMGSKVGSLLGRSALSMIIAFAGALPWVTMSLKAAVQVEMTKMSLAEHASLRNGVDTLYGVADIDKRAQVLQAEATGWAAALATLPPAIQTALNQAQICSLEYGRLSDAAERKASTLNSRLGLLAHLESAQSATPATIKAVAVERAQIHSTLTKAAQEVSTKKADCNSRQASADAARAAHVNFATTEQGNSARRLAELRKDEGDVTAKVQVEHAKIETLVKENAATNSSAEFSALMQVIKTQLFAQFLAGLIFLGLFLVDVLPLTLRLFSNPGPYDGEKRCDDAIRNMRAEGRYLEAKMMHEARREEMASKELKDQVRIECRPHIRSITLNGVSSFLRKQTGQSGRSTASA